MPQIRKDNVEAMQDGTWAEKQKTSWFVDMYAKKADVNETTERYGSGSRTAAGYTLNKVPLYFTTPIQNKALLSTQLTNTIAIYSNMGLNYQAMSELADYTTLLGDVIERRSAVGTGGYALNKSKAIGEGSLKAFKNWENRTIYGQSDEK